MREMDRKKNNKRAKSKRSVFYKMEETRGSLIVELRQFLTKMVKAGHILHTHSINMTNFKCSV